MTCHEAREAFSALHDDVLPPPARDAVRGHLQVCPACQAEWSAFQQTVRAVSSLGSAEPSPGFAARIRQQLDAPPWWKRAARWLFLPVKVKVPLQAAALLVLGLAGLLLSDRSPDVRKITQPLTTTPPAVSRDIGPVPLMAPAPGPEASKAGEGSAPPSTVESRKVDTPTQVPGLSAPAQTPVPATVTQASPPDEQARSGQAESALSARRSEERPARETESGTAGRLALQPPQAPAPTAAPPTLATPSRKTLAARTPDALYSAALTELAGKRYEQAISGFRAFIAQYPQDPKVPYARLALGDAQAAQGRQPEAIQEYETLIQQFPQSPLVPSALYRQAQARLALGDSSGCLQFRDLADRFPRAPEAGQARDALARRCP